MLTGIESLDSFLFCLGFLFIAYISLSIICYFIHLRDDIDELNHKIDILIKKKKY